MILETDTIVAGRYRLSSILHKNYYSATWIADDLHQGTNVVAKFYTSLASDEEVHLVGNTLNKILTLSHPNIVCPLRTGIEDKIPFSISSYYESGSYDNKVGKMSENDVWQLIADISFALIYLHELSLPHQGISPSNVLIAGENACLADFAINTCVFSVIQRTMAIGFVGDAKLAYYPPEKFVQYPVANSACDIWALGATAFELFTGFTPFGEKGGWAQKKGERCKPIGLCSDLLKEALQSCLSISPMERPTARKIHALAMDALSNILARQTFQQNSSDSLSTSLEVVEIVDEQPEININTELSLDSALEEKHTTDEIEFELIDEPSLPSNDKTDNWETGLSPDKYEDNSVDMIELGKISIDKKRQRHWFITVWLSLVMTFDAAFFFFFAFSAKHNIDAGLSFFQSLIAGYFSLIDLLAVILLFNWKKNGFFVKAISTLLFVLLFAFLDINKNWHALISELIGCILGLSLLYGILQIRSKKISFWALLEKGFGFKRSMVFYAVFNAALLAYTLFILMNASSFGHNPLNSYSADTNADLTAIDTVAILDADEMADDTTAVTRLFSADEDCYIDVCPPLDTLQLSDDQIIGAGFSDDYAYVLVGREAVEDVTSIGVSSLSEYMELAMQQVEGQLTDFRYVVKEQTCFSRDSSRGKSATFEYKVGNMALYFEKTYYKSDRYYYTVNIWCLQDKKEALQNVMREMASSFYFNK